MCSNETRTLIINALSNLGKSVREVAGLYNVNRKTVSSIKAVFLKEGRTEKRTKKGIERPYSINYKNLEFFNGLMMIVY